MKMHSEAIPLEAMMSPDRSLPAPAPKRKRILIVEDDFASQRLLKKLLSRFGESDIAADGREGVTAFQKALVTGEPYDLVCLDIMMPQLDGQDALKQMRELESQRGVISSQGAKIIMTTALADMKNVMSAYSSLCDGYLTKPITGAGLNSLLKDLKIVEPGAA